MEIQQGHELVSSIFVYFFVMVVTDKYTHTHMQPIIYYQFSSKYHSRALVFNSKNMIRLWDIAYDGYNG